MVARPHYEVHHWYPSGAASVLSGRLRGRKTTGVAVVIGDLVPLAHILGRREALSTPNTGAFFANGMLC